MILQLREEWAIEPIFQMVIERADLFDIQKDKLRDYLEDAIKNDSSIVLLDEKDNRIDGFVFASVEEFNGDDVCFIHVCIVAKEKKYTVHDFIGRLRAWSNERGLKTMIMSTNKHEKGFERKYGFKYLSTLMTLSVDK